MVGRLHLTNARDRGNAQHLRGALILEFRRSALKYLSSFFVSPNMILISIFKHNHKYIERECTSLNPANLVLS